MKKFILSLIFLPMFALADTNTYNILDATNLSPVPSIRMVANRTAFPTSIVAVKQAFSISYHIAGDTICSLAIVTATSYGTGGVEVTTGLGVITFTASIEYPVNDSSANGRLSQIKWSGLTSQAQAVGTLVVSDVTPVAGGLCIPKGATFGIRVWQGATNATGVLNTGGMNAARQISGGPVADVFRSGTTITDQTNIVINSGNTFPSDVRGYKPVAILGYSNVDSVAIIGDSRDQGWQGGYGPQRALDANGWIGIGESVVGPTRLPFTNLAFASDSAVNFTVALAPLRTQVLQWATKIYCGYGINDISGGTTAAGLNGRIWNIRQLTYALNKQFVGSTLAPESTGAWTLANLSDQTTWAQEANRVAYNELLRSGKSHIDVVIEAADAFESGRNSGLWPAGSRQVTDAVLTAGTYTVTSVTALWAAADIGQAVACTGAGYGAAVLDGVILSFSGNVATITTPVGTTVASLGTCLIGKVYTHDGIHPSLLAVKNFQATMFGQIPFK